MCLHPDMQRLLRDYTNWQGYVISDEGSITFAGPGYHGFTDNLVDAACLALNAGTVKLLALSTSLNFIMCPTFYPPHVIRNPPLNK